MSALAEKHENTLFVINTHAVKTCSHKQRYFKKLTQQRKKEKQPKSSFNVDNVASDVRYVQVFGTGFTLILLNGFLFSRERNDFVAKVQ